MTAKARTVKIDFTVRDGYDTIITEGFSIPAGMPTPRAIRVIELRLASLLETAEFLNPTATDDEPIESVVTPS